MNLTQDFVLDGTFFFSLASKVSALLPCFWNTLAVPRVLRLCFTWITISNFANISSKSPPTHPVTCSSQFTEISFLISEPNLEEATLQGCEKKKKERERKWWIRDCKVFLIIATFCPHVLDPRSVNQGPGGQIHFAKESSIGTQLHRFLRCLWLLSCFYRSRTRHWRTGKAELLTLWAFKKKLVDPCCFIKG